MTKDYLICNDEELVVMAHQGDDMAQEYLINRYKSLVKSKAHLYFIVGADREDVVQEGMIGLFKAIRDFNSERHASFKTFAALCINRQILTAIKAASRLRHSPLNNSISLNAMIGEQKEGSEMLESLVASADNNPEELMLIRDTIDDIIINIPKYLSKFEQQVWREYLAGKDYNMIAEEMGKMPKSIDNALQRIKKKITAHI